MDHDETDLATLDDHDLLAGGVADGVVAARADARRWARLVEFHRRCGLDFEALQLRLHPAASRVRMLAEQTPASFIAFDLLALGDDDYTQRPFSERRAALVDALAGAGQSFHVTPATTDPATAQRWFSEFEGAGLDGVVAKPLAIPYLPDKRIMFKIKHQRTADCVVAGYRLHKSGADAIGSLMLGPLGLVLAAPAAHLAGVKPALLGCAAVMILATLAALLAPGVRNLRARDPELPAPAAGSSAATSA